MANDSRRHQQPGSPGADRIVGTAYRRGTPALAGSLTPAGTVTLMLRRAARLQQWPEKR